MKRILPWLLLPYISLSHADSSNSLEGMLNKVSEEASQTTLNSIETKAPQVPDKEPSAVKPTDVDVDQLTQSIAGRLSELLGTDTETNPKQLTVSLESVVSSALQDGKEMDEIRDAVAQAMKDVTGQNLQLNPDVAKIEAEMARHSISPKPQAKSVIPPPGAAVTASKQPVASDSSSNANISVNKNNRKLNSQNSIDQPLQEDAPLENTTTVLAGESLFRVAQRVYGEENGRRFLDLFEANKDVIEDVNVVFEGQVLKVPE